MIVIDASAALRWFIPAAPTASTYPIPETDQPLVAPDLFVAEIRNTALIQIRKKELDRDQAIAMVATIDSLMTGYFPMPDLAATAWSMALEFDHSPYDCFYIALARQLDTVVVTADRRMIRKFASTAFSSRLINGADWTP
jgi:predicted nucleic acid-binding protein